MIEWHCEALLCTVQEAICTITLNRPQVANALNLELLKAFRELLWLLRFEPEVRVVILTGAGDKAFCAGADLKERLGMPPEKVKEFIFTIRGLTSELEDLPRPVIAAINGLALGGGTELALACDVRIASQSAQLGLTETALGIIPGAGGTQRLPRLVGKGRAKELIFTARKVPAAEALQLGLVEHMVSPADLLESARALARQMAHNGPIALESAKWAINRGTETDIATGLEIESRAYESVLGTQDRIEGLLAFKEKRRPVFHGH